MLSEQRHRHPAAAAFAGEGNVQGPHLQRSLAAGDKAHFPSALCLLCTGLQEGFHLLPQPSPQYQLQEDRDERATK